ncbi:HTH-type transcriptional regulator GbpR [Serratia ficaria]|uniref:LysR substrate-binding domain-containing protein n=1 Tax=Serratia ficaria TaxID=61651 RepID=UPI00119A850D|nr:LysR substrate-binding domain-containing protein [Serratia ficaria]VVA46781.1 HTH-type transcriptional regulator GbpR [Serratia ficaria]
MKKANLFIQRMRLRHINGFVAVAQERSLSRAADKLNLSQPALSKTLSELEALTGNLLLVRHRQGTQLTEQGEQFLGYATRVLEALAAAGHALERFDEAPARALRIGALPTAALGMLPQAIGQYQQAHPHARIQVITAKNDELLAQLKAGELEVAIGRMAEPAMMSGIAFELLLLESLLLVTRPGHPLLSETVTLERALSYPAILSPKGTVPRHNTENLLSSRGFSLPGQYVETLSASLARQMSLQFDYLWFVPSSAVKDDIAGGQLIPLPLATQGMEEAVGILTRNDGEHSDAVLAFIASVRRIAGATRHG